MKSLIALRGHHLDALQDYVFIAHFRFGRDKAQQQFYQSRSKWGYGKQFSQRTAKLYDKIYTAAITDDTFQETSLMVKLVDIADDICNLNCGIRNIEQNCDEPWQKDHEVAKKYGLDTTEEPFPASEIINAVFHQIVNPISKSD